MCRIPDTSEPDNVKRIIWARTKNMNCFSVVNIQFSNETSLLHFIFFMNIPISSTEGLSTCSQSQNYYQIVSWPWYCFTWLVSQSICLTWTPHWPPRCPWFLKGMSNIDSSDYGTVSHILFKFTYSCRWSDKLFTDSGFSLLVLKVIHTTEPCLFSHLVPWGGLLHPLLVSRLSLFHKDSSRFFQFFDHSISCWW